MAATGYFTTKGTKSTKEERGKESLRAFACDKKSRKNAKGGSATTGTSLLFVYFVPSW